MIQVVKTAPEFTFVNNPIVYELKTVDDNGDAYRDYGAKSTATFNFGFTWTPGDRIVVGWKDSDNRLKISAFYATSNPTQDNEFPLSATLADVAHVISHSVYVSPELYVYADGLKLTIEAKDNGAKEVSFDVSTLSFATSINEVATDFNAPSGHRVAITIAFEKSINQNNWHYVSNIEAFANPNGSNVILPIHNILRSEALASVSKYPFHYYSRTVAKLSDNVRRYRLELKDLDDTGLLSFQSTAINAILIGGINSHVFNNQNWFAQRNIQNCFLTYQPNFKQVFWDGIEYLTWFNYTGSEQSIAMFVKIYEATSVIAEYTIMEIVVPSGMSATFPISPSALGVPNTALYYEIQVKSATADLSPLRTYIIKEDVKHFTLGYVNAFGVVETATCEGNLTQTVKINAEKNTTSDVNNVFKNRTETTLQTAYTYRSGYLTSPWKEAYSEVAISTVLFDVTTERYIALRLIDNPKEEVIRKENESLYSWEWKTEFFIEEENFSPDALLRASESNNTPGNISVGSGGNLMPSQNGEVYIKYKSIANLATLTNLKNTNALSYPTIYYSAAGEGAYLATSINNFISLGAGLLQIQQYPFEINENVTQITVTGFDMVYDDPNILVFLGGTLRNSGVEKDYRILSGNRVKFQWTPTESITGVVIKITL